MTWVKGVPPKMLKDRFGAYSSKGGRVGWHGEMDRCWIRTRLGKVEHVTISRGTGTCDGSGEVSWSEKMRIKNELFGENRFAIEVFPKQDNLVDVCDVYHLWVFDKKLEMPFGIAPKEYQKAINRGYNVSYEDIAAMVEDYKRYGKM